MSGQIGAGARLYYGATNAPSTEITGVVEFNFPKFGVGKVETTDLLSTAEEYVGGLKKGDDMNFTVKYTPALYNTLLGLRGTMEYWKCVSSGGTYGIFQGFVMDVEHDVKTKELEVLKVSVCISNDVTVTVVS